MFICMILLNPVSLPHLFFPCESFLSPPPLPNPSLPFLSTFTYYPALFVRCLPSLPNLIDSHPPSPFLLSPIFHSILPSPLPLLSLIHLSVP